MRLLQVGFKEVREVGFTPDGRTVVVFGCVPPPGQCEWHDLAGAHPPRVHTLRHFSSGGFAVSPIDGTVLVCDAADLLEFRTPTAEPLRHGYQEGWLNKLAVSTNARQMVWAKDGIPHRRNPLMPRLFGYTRKGKSWKPTWQQDGYGTRFGRPVFLPDGKRLAVLELRGKKVKGQFQPESTLLTLSTKGNVLRERSFPGSFLELALCGEYLVLGDSHLLRVLPLSDLDADPILVSLGNKHLSALAGDPHGRFLLAACSQKVLVFDPVSWKVARQYDWKIGTVNCLAVSADGTVCAAGGSKKQVAVWDAE